MAKYEIELVEHPSYCVALIATLTGYEPEEIIAITGDTEGGFRSKDFRNAFNSLGYSCNNRFIKFDKDTEHISLLRARPVGKQKYKHWFALGYNAGEVYIPTNGIYTLGEFYYLRWTEHELEVEITSMINIWL